MGMTDQQERQPTAETPSSQKFGKCSARDSSFLTNDISYLAPAQFKPHSHNASAEMYNEAKLQIRTQLEKLNKYKRKIKKQSQEKAEL
jgi:hypothetical protein